MTVSVKGLPCCSSFIPHKTVCPISEMRKQEAEDHLAVPTVERGTVSVSTPQPMLLTTELEESPLGNNSRLAIPGKLRSAVVKAHLRFITYILPGAQARFLAGREASLCSRDRGTLLQVPMDISHCASSLQPERAAIASVPACQAGLQTKIQDSQLHLNLTYPMNNILV